MRSSSRLRDIFGTYPVPVLAPPSRNEFRVSCSRRDVERANSRFLLLKNEIGSRPSHHSFCWMRKTNNKRSTINDRNRSCFTVFLPQWTYLHFRIVSSARSVMVDWKAPDCQKDVLVPGGFRLLSAFSSHLSQSDILLVFCTWYPGTGTTR
jgi:hypothetical protein